MRLTSFHIVNLGCKVNRVESDSMRASLIAGGAAESEIESADLIIVNTCTVTGEADKKARKAVHHALAANPLADVVVTGCAAAVNPRMFESMDPRVRIAGKRMLEQKLAEGLGAQALRMGRSFRTRVGLKVQDGCDHACTYCIVHVARGAAISVPAVDVLAEAHAYFEAGVKEIVLTGIDIGAYRDGAHGLADLIHLLIDDADATCSPGDVPARLRISSIEPLSVDEGLMRLLSSSKGRLCRHLHVPMQSGSSKVLREMGRPYDAERYRALVLELRENVPGLALSTDVIVGFPGETERDFEETCDLVKSAGFMRLHVFPYSQRQGTPAALRKDQVDAGVKRERAARLRAIGKQLAHADFASRAGTSEQCIVEGKTALTESYHEIKSPDGAAPGDLVSVVL